MSAPDDIVKKLAEMTPTAPSEIDGSPSCFFCTAFIPEKPADHDDDCIWRAAVELTGRFR